MKEQDSKNSDMTPEKIGFRKLIKAIKNCNDDVQDKVLDEYRKL